MVYGTSITIVTGANLNQLITGGPHIVLPNFQTDPPGFSQKWLASNIEGIGLKAKFEDVKHLHYIQAGVPMHLSVSKPCRKREITSLCRITLLTPDLTQCLRDHNFDFRGMHVHIIT